MVLKDIAKGTYENAIKDENKRNINDTYQEKLGIGTFTGNIDGLGDGGLPYTSSICWCDSSKVSGSLPYYGSTSKYWFVLETNVAIDNQESSIRSQKATIWQQDGNRVFERIFTNVEWYAWKEYLRTDGDLKDTTVSFTSGDYLNPTGWTAIGKIFSGARLKDILNGFSTGIKNLRFLYKLIGTTDISKIGDGTLTGIVSALNTDIQTVGNRYTIFNSGPNSNRKLTFSGIFSAIVSVRGAQTDAFGAFFVQGYGIGSARIHVAAIQDSPSVTCTVIETEESIFLRNKTVAVSGSVFMLLGTLPVIAPA